MFPKALTCFTALNKENKRAGHVLYKKINERHKEAQPKGKKGKEEF